LKKGGALKTKNKLFVEGRNSDATKEADTKDNFNQFHNGESGKNNSQTNKGVGDLVSSGFDIFLITTGHDPFEATQDEDEKENQSDGEHGQRDGTGNNTAGSHAGERIKFTSLRPNNNFALGDGGFDERKYVCHRDNNINN